VERTVVRPTLPGWTGLPLALAGLPLGAAGLFPRWGRALHPGRVGRTTVRSTLSLLRAFPHLRCRERP